MCPSSVLSPPLSEPLYAGEERQTALRSRGSPVGRPALEGAGFLTDAAGDSPAALSALWRALSGPPEAARDACPQPSAP